MDSLKSLVEHMAKSLVDKPEMVDVEEIPGPQTTLLALKVDKEDLGKVIGKQGKTAAAMRTIIRAAGTKLNKRYHLDIIE
ncbi:MAG: KH domain-containing protein [Bdellovibrionaceae bacterium]|nr:KH domain-containing protein [Pseudobdellovibrionaceae bacterium]